MEMTTIYIYGTIGALLFLIIGVMLGYVRCEYQHGATVRKNTDDVAHQRHVLIEMHNADLAQERSVVRELEIALLQAGESIERSQQQVEQAQKNWKFADKFRKAIVTHMVNNHIWNFNVHAGDPMAMMAEIIKWETKIALDPAVSKLAKNLHTAGVRKGAKKGRAQMQKLMQKSIDNQAETIIGLDSALFESQGKRQIYKEAVNNVLNDKVALPGVRKSIRNGITEEISRLYLVAAKKGA